MWIIYDLKFKANFLIIKSQIEIFMTILFEFSISILFYFLNLIQVLMIKLIIVMIVTFIIFVNYYFNDFVRKSLMSSLKILDLYYLNYFH
jgi:hypothetical protein